MTQPLSHKAMPVALIGSQFKFYWHVISGSHPTVGEDEVDVTLVQAVTGQNMTAKVKNCNDEYFVYHLEPTGACPEAYCFGIFVLLHYKNLPM